MLVALGSTSVMLTNLYAISVFGEGDPVRLGAQVISGIGFLGAGTILTTKHNQIRGLTTAAGLWAVACLGLAIGIGFYEVALLSSLLLMIILITFRKVKRKVYSRTKYMEILIAFDSKEGIKNLLTYCIENNWGIIDVNNDESRFNEGGFFYHFSLKFSSIIETDDIIKIILNLDGVMYVKNIH